MFVVYIHYLHKDINMYMHNKIYYLKIFVLFEI